MAEPKTAIAKKVNEPAIFVFANNRTNFESQIELNVTILNVNKIDKSEHLTSPQFFIQSLPFHIDIHHETKKPSGKKAKIDNLNIQLVVGKGIQDQWSSQFSVDLVVSTQVPQFRKLVVLELSDTNDTISHTIEFDAVRKHENFYFQMHISAGQPNGGYKWPSHAATGYNGIVNEGATCYINCLLQSLYFTNAFRRLVYGTPIESEDFNESFLFWLKYIFFTLQFTTNGLPKITTKKMIKCFNWNEINETSQQDVQTFLRLLMNKIEQSVDGTEFKQRLTDLFVGTKETTIQCQNVVCRSSTRVPFWYVQLSIDESPNIYGAFGVYLKTIKINDFKYGERAGAKDVAMKECQIIKWPPVLHVHLKRFSYDVEANSSTKNNKRFAFFSQLDLSHFSDDAIYTLHSVLVHSGSPGSGHYVSYICPKADNHWFKFDDEIVMECSASNAIQDNYGDGSSSTSAYVLVYVKTSCIQEILQDVSKADVSDKALIERELTKEIQELGNQRQKRRVYLSFKDQTAKRDPMEVDFDDTEMFSVAIERIADVMDMDRSKSHFFDSTGAEITHFKGTVSQYLKSHSATIDYKVIDRSVLNVLVVNSNGYAGDVQSIPINRSTTVGDICDGFESKHAKVVKMKGDVIVEIVARNTKAIKLIDDGHAYRIDLYSSSIGCANKNENKMFHVCVKFIGDSPPDRQKTPVLVKIENGETFDVIGVKLFEILRLENPAAIDAFQYSMYGKFVKSCQARVKPNDLKTIPVVLLNMNESKTRNPNFLYKGSFKN